MIFPIYLSWFLVSIGLKYLKTTILAIDSYLIVSMVVPFFKVGLDNKHCYCKNLYWRLFVEMLKKRKPAINRYRNFTHLLLRMLVNGYYMPISFR